MTATFWPGEITSHCQVALAAMEKALVFLDEETGRRFLQEARKIKEIRSPQDYRQLFRCVRQVTTLFLGMLSDRMPCPDVVALVRDLRAAEAFFDELIALGLSGEFD